MTLPLWLRVALLIAVVIRVGGLAVSAVSNTHGDYYASLPGAYVRTVNPTLWNSPDMSGAMGFHLDTYYHGPTQYLTLYPVAFFDSYEQIARVLLVVYALVIAAALAFLVGALRRLAPGVAPIVPITSATLLFFPLLQAYLQREFELVILLGLSAALWALVVDRSRAVGALLAYVAWFKYVPLLFFPYLVLRGWMTAAITFIVTSAIVLFTAHALFDLSLFVNNNVPGHAAQVLQVARYGFVPDAANELVGVGFCAGWFASETTLANIRHGLCSISVGREWLPPNLVYLLICAMVAAAYLLAHARFQRRRDLSPEQEAWRRALEFSIVTTICACFFFAHYYYLILLVIPLNVLLTRYLSRADRVRLTAWLLAYVLLSAFLVPTSILTQVFATDVWASYIKGAWFLYGELLLMALLLREYVALSRERDSSANYAD